MMHVGKVVSLSLFLLFFLIAQAHVQKHMRTFRYMSEMASFPGGQMRIQTETITQVFLYGEWMDTSNFSWFNITASYTYFMVASQKLLQVSLVPWGSSVSVIFFTCCWHSFWFNIVMNHRLISSQEACFIRFVFVTIMWHLLYCSQQPPNYSFYMSFDGTQAAS